MNERRVSDKTVHPEEPLYTEQTTILVGIKAGSEAALRELIRKYTSPLLRIANTIVNDDDIAKDIVQDVFCWVWEKKESLIVPGSLIAYLGRATSNRAISELRKQKAQSKLKSFFASHTAEGHKEVRSTEEADHQVSKDDLQAALEKSLTLLQPRTREIFLLHLDDGLRYSEIAEALGITVETVRMQMYRATKKLAEELRDFLV